MTQSTMVSPIPPAPSLETAWEDVGISFQRFCLTAGSGALEQMLREDAERLAGPRHGRNPERAGRRWGPATGKIGFHGGKVEVRRPRRFVALSTQRMADWMSSDLSRLDLWAIQIDGLHVGRDLVLVAALGIDDADKAERLLRNLAQRLDRERSGVAKSLLEGLDEMLTVNLLGLPPQLRRALACTNSIENMMGMARRVCRKVKRWRNAEMALRWTAAGMMEAAKGFRRLKAYKQLPALKAALLAHQNKHAIRNRLEENRQAYDTQNIKEQYAEAHGSESNSKLAVWGALSLYLNFINLFPTPARPDWRAGRLMNATVSWSRLRVARVSHIRALPPTFPARKSDREDAPRAGGPNS